MELQSHPFFQVLCESNIDPLTKKAHVQDYGDEEIIFEEGSEPDGLFLVLEGEVAFRKRLPNGAYYTVSSSQQGEFFGEIGVITRQTRALRAVSQGSATLARIPAESLEEYLRELPGPIEDILKGIIKHLRDTTDHYLHDMLQKEKLAIVGNMINSIIHDFKNPFCLISLHAQLIEQLHADERTRELCSNIREQVDRMVAMASEIGEYSRGQHAPELSVLKLSEVIDRFHALNSPFFESGRITIQVTCEEVYIMGEESKVIRVLQNLVSNAIDAIPEGAPGRIEIEGKALSKSQVYLGIRDTGVGIPEEIRTRMFEPFVTMGKSAGTGLGTAIAKSIIDSHGGSIAFESKLGAGTTFHITLPRAPRRAGHKRKAGSVQPNPPQ